MKKAIIFSLIIALGFAGIGARRFQRKFLFSSSSFKDGAFIPDKYTKTVNGQNTSPALSWRNSPLETKSYVITCIDTNPVAQNWVHWMVINIPANIYSLSKGASTNQMPTGCKELMNSYGDFGYGGPNPPPTTGVHRYIFTIYALNTASISVKKNFISEAKLKKLLRGKILAKASWSGKYKR